MGLDMYLQGRIWIEYDDKYKELRTHIQKELGLDYQVDSIKFDLMYWRKANAIHKWFVDNVQNGVDDCGDYDVSPDQLMELRKVCKKALATKDRKDDVLFADDAEKPEDVLPTQSGFFFGGTEYDDYYYNDLRSTIDFIDKFLDNPIATRMDITYRSSW